MLTFFKSKRDKKDRAIFSAAEYEDWPTVFTFLDQSYPVNYPDPDTQLTLLEFADKQRHIRVINALKEQYGATDRETIKQKEADFEISSITSQMQTTSIHWQSPQPTKRPSLIPPIKPQAAYPQQLNTLTKQLKRIALHERENVVHKPTNGRAKPAGRKTV
jgi:hypothetical protein